eukprot:254217_1
MTTSETSNGWIKLVLPDEFATHLININEYGFILFSFGSSNLNAYKYNAFTNSFSQFISNKNTSICTHSIQITFDNKQQIFYIREAYGMHDRTNIHSLDVNTNIFNKLQHNGAKMYASGGHFLFANNHLHVIRNYDSHWIGSIDNNTLHIVSKPTMQSSRFSGAAIYISSRQSILLIGGFNEYGLPCDVWIYSLKTQKWNKINNISFKRFQFGYVLSSNQRYIILFGGWKYVSETDQDVEVDDIVVLDMKDDNNWKLKQCEIKCPVFGTCYGARTGGCDSNNQILVNGFVKKCFKLKEFLQLQLPPVYIINIINKYFSAEMIHCIEDKDHYGIYLKQILSSL